MGKSIVICGSIAIDRIMSFSGKYADLIEPSKLDVLSLSVFIDTLKDARGGNGANISYALASLGEKPILIGSVGAEADTYLSDLRTKGIDISGVHKSSLPTASFTVLTDSAHNQIGGFYPGAMGDSESVSYNSWSGQDVLACVSVHDPDAMRRQVQECKKNNLILMYDPGQQITNLPAEDLAAGVDGASIVIVNEYELTALSKKIGLSEQELSSKVPIFITTHGKDGSVISGKNVSEPIKVGIAQAAQVVDPTGAGDAYRAGFLFGFTREWELADCARLGAVMASFVLEQVGTQVEVTKEKILSRYKETFKKEIEL